LNPHYSIRMDKAHILMPDGYPLNCIHSGGGANDNPFASRLVDRLSPVDGATFHADGAYDAFLTYTNVYQVTGAVMRCNHGSNTLFHGVDEHVIRRRYGRMWRLEGYDSERKDDLDFVLRFLCQHGEEVLVGKHLRDRSMLLPPDGRSVR